MTHQSVSKKLDQLLNRSKKNKNKKKKMKTKITKVKVKVIEKLYA